MTTKYTLSRNHDGAITLLTNGEDDHVIAYDDHPLWQAIMAFVESAVLAEREACAKVCENRIDEVSAELCNRWPAAVGLYEAANAAKHGCADAIRQRTDAKGE